MPTPKLENPFLYADLHLKNTLVKFVYLKVKVKEQQGLSGLVSKCLHLNFGMQIQLWNI